MLDLFHYLNLNMNMKRQQAIAKHLKCAGSVKVA